VSETIAADALGVEHAVARLKAGQLVAFPTETVYGLGADARNEEAVGSVFDLKGRPADHPLIVHLRSQEQLAEWASTIPTYAQKAADAFWPGPLTLVLPRAAGVPDGVTGGQDTVALRVPSHPVAHALLQTFGGGIAAPSANRFGRISPTTARHVADEFGESDLLILEGGASEVGLESTILDASGPEPRLLRPGAITPAMLEAAMGRALATASEAVPRAPGRLASHYAPAASAKLVSRAFLEDESKNLEGWALLVRLANLPEKTLARAVRLPCDVEGYARGLYAALRELDERNPKGILIEEPPHDPDWLAVRDRLARATHGNSRHDHGESDTVETNSDVPDGLTAEEGTER